MSRKKIDISELNLKLIGGRIAYLRISNGLTQESLSESIGISKGNISALENNKYEPSAKAIVKISKLFQVTTDWILIGDNESKEPENIIAEQQNMLKKFKDPLKGLENNQYLAGIEMVSEELYEKVSDYLKTTYDTAKTLANERKK